MSSRFGTASRVMSRVLAWVKRFGGLGFGFRVCRMLGLGFWLVVRARLGQSFECATGTIASKVPRTTQLLP